MNTNKDTKTAEHSKTPIPVFEHWLSDNPTLTEYLSKKDWYTFFQKILQALKKQDNERIFEFLDNYLPKLISNNASQNIIEDSIAHLRSVILNYILNGPDIRQKNKELWSIKTQLLFDDIVRSIQEKYAKLGKIPTNDSYAPNEMAVQQLDSMAFYLKDSRLKGAGYINPIFQKWTGVTQEDFSGNPDWKSYIHPDDYDEANLKLNTLIESRTPFYELHYRLQNNQNNWQHVVELGRVLYGEKSNATAFIGIIREARNKANVDIDDIELIKIFKCFFDNQQDYAFVVDDEGYLVYVTQSLLNFLNPVETNSKVRVTGERFYNLLEANNKKNAMNYWESAKEDLSFSKPLTLTFSDKRNGQPQFIQFKPYSLEHTFEKSLRVFLGNISFKKEPSETFAGRVENLIASNREITQSGDLKSFYLKVVDKASQLIPNSGAVALLLKTARGFVYYTGIGFQNEKLENLILLNQNTKDRLNQIEKIKSLRHEAQILQFSDVKDHLRSIFSATQYHALEKYIKIQELQQLLCATIKKDDHPYAILLLFNYDKNISFNEADRNLLELFVQQTSNSLQQLHLMRKLQETEFNYYTVLEKSPLAIFIIQDKELKLFNPKFLEFTGLANYEALKNDIWRYIHPEDSAVLKEKLMDLDGKLTFLKHDFRFVKKSRETVYCSGAFVSIRYNNRPAILCELKDITRQRTLEEQLPQAQKMATMDMLATGIAHDFNNVMGGIIPSAQLIIRNPKSPETVKHARTIFRLAKRASSITRQLLAYASQDSQEMMAINLNDFLSETRNMLENIVGPNIKLMYDLHEGVPNIQGNRHQIIQMLVNLITNARDAFTDSGTIRVTTEVIDIKEKKSPYHTFQPGKYVQISVQDNGKGIPRDIINKIFQPFFTTKPSEKGKGLGLSIVYGILKKHDGYVLIQSVENRGTSCKVFFPLSAKQPSEPIVESDEEIIEGEGTILIIDDEKYLREVFKSMIKLMGYNFIEAANGKEAVEVYKANKDRVDLVILDYAMPGLNGKQTYYLLKKLNPNIRVILCTGYSEQKKIWELTRHENVEFLPKPFTIETLSKRIHSLLDAASARKKSISTGNGRTET